MIADGNPAEVRGINQVGLERQGYAPEKIKPIKEAFRLIYRGRMNTGQALEAVREQLGASEDVQAILQFIAASERGIIR
jgi:UDP-N-acetylglucosamine acyltransferase